MVRRRRKWRKVFVCGHRGFGRYCHRCDAWAQSATQASGTRQRDRSNKVKPVIIDGVHRAKKSKPDRTWQRRFETDPIELRHLPKAIVIKTRRILDLLDQGIAPGELKGRRFNFDRTLLRIPVSYRYRLLCRWQADRIVPLQVLSHEAYNAIARNKKSPRLKKG